jgi:predicted DNA-binding ribbon-helix-helix protein
MRKRSVTIEGHRTSISLEDAFWTEVVRLARERSMSLNMLVAEVDRARRSEDVNLSSALRLYVLSELVKKRDAAPELISL